MHRRSATVTFLLATSALSAATHQWDDPSYSFAPLTQPASANLLPPIEPGLKGWGPRNGATTTTVEGKPAIQLSAGTSDGPASIRVSVDAEPETLYEMRFRIEFSLDVKLNFDASYPGLHGWLAPRGKPFSSRGAIRLRELRSAGQWWSFRTELFTPPGYPPSLAIQPLRGERKMRNRVFRSLAKGESNERH